MALHELSKFPSFVALDGHKVVDTFIQEALAVYETLTVKPDCVRTREQWDNPANTNPLLQALEVDGNSHWIVSQNNSDWLNYPLMYYDKVVGTTPNLLCPTIISFLKQVGSIRIAGFSLFKPNGHIPPHTDSTGLSQDSLACHVCLVGKGELSLENGTVICQQPKKVYIFDSEYTHSVKNTGDDVRIILYMDFVYSKHVNEPMVLSYHTPKNPQKEERAIWNWSRQLVSTLQSYISVLPLD